MMTNDEAKKSRREAYQRAKAARDSDPAYRALKEKLKEKRKAEYRANRDAQRQKKLEAKKRRIAEKDAALMALVTFASELKSKEQ